jgi:hypothetical protein
MRSPRALRNLSHSRWFTFADAMLSARELRALFVVAPLDAGFGLKPISDPGRLKSLLNQLPIRARAPREGRLVGRPFG